MLIERREPDFKPVVIVLDSPQELSDFQEMAKYAFNQCDSHSDLDRITRKFYYAVKDLK